MSSPEEIAVAGTESDSADDIRRRIAQVATQLFGAKGFAATSIRDIAQAASVTNPTIYYHFAQDQEGIARAS